MKFREALQGIIEHNKEFARPNFDGATVVYCTCGDNTMLVTYKVRFTGEPIEGTEKEWLPTQEDVFADDWYPYWD